MRKKKIKVGSYHYIKSPKDAYGILPAEVISKHDHRFHVRFLGVELFDIYPAKCFIRELTKSEVLMEMLE